MRPILISLFLVFGLISCASKKEKMAVKEEMSRAPVIQNEKELYNQQIEILSNNESLTAEQRSKLTSLIEKSRVQSQEIQNEIEKTKLVLFKELVSVKGSKARINILETQLLKLNRKKTRYSISAYREAKTIVGKNEVPLSKTLNLLDNRTIHEF
jgi:hypothetical protein